MPSAEPFEWPQGTPLFEVMWRSVTESLAGNGIVSNGDLEVTATANALEIQVAAGDYFSVATTYTLGAAETHTLSAGDGTHDRWDTVWFDTGTGASGVTEGTPAADPEPPDVTGDQEPLAFVYVAQNASDVTDAEVLNWRAKFSNEAEEVHYDDSTGVYSVNNVDAALDELQEAAQATAYPFALAVDTDMDVAGTDLTDAGTVLYESSNAWFRNEVVQALANFTADEQFGSYPLPIGDLNSPYALPSISDMDAAGNDLVDGGTTIWDTSAGWVPREQVDDERVTSGVKTAAYTTAGEEVVQVDTSGGAVTITLASADIALGNFVQVQDVGGAAETNAITVDTEGGEGIDGGTSITLTTNYGAKILASDGTQWYTAGGSAAGGGVDTEDNGASVVSGATAINFATDLSVTDDGDGTVTVDSDAAGVSVLASGTFTHTGGSASSTTVAGVTSDQTANLYVEVGVDADPSFSADYAWDYTETVAWDDTNSQQDVIIDATWITDPGSGNDVTLDYRIYTLDVSVSKSRIQDLVDSPNGNVPTALLEDTESIEASVPVPHGESLKVYRWGAYKISDGTAPTGLQVQLLDGSDTVQASENTVNTEATGSPVASHGNGSGSLSIFKLRIDNGTGNAYTTDGVGGIFAYVVE